MNHNDGFKHACRFIFGQEIGDLQDYDGYLKQAVVGQSVNSFLSNEKIFITSDQYARNARFFNYEKELNQINEILTRPISINQIKDVDSLFEAVEEKIIYAGTKVLGKSTNILNSDNIHNSNNVLESSFVYGSKHIAYSHKIRNSEYIFGCTCMGENSWIVKSFSVMAAQRCFECSMSVASYDCYFCYNIHNSRDCMFTFHKKSVNNMIGNVQLEKSKYLELKQKLLNEIIELLKKNKKLDISILNIPFVFGWVNE